MSEEVKFFNQDNESFADVTTRNNLTFTCRVSGLENTGETVILLHGFPSTSHMWHELIDFLSNENYRVIAPNQRGYSQGARPSEISEYRIDWFISEKADTPPILRYMATTQIGSVENHFYTTNL